MPDELTTETQNMASSRLNLYLSRSKNSINEQIRRDIYGNKNQKNNSYFTASLLCSVIDSYGSECKRSSTKKSGGVYKEIKKETEDMQNEEKITQGSIKA